MLHRLFLSTLAAACLLLGACQGYDFTINEKVVYAPVPLFTDFATSDPALGNCLRQTINDERITEAAHLKALDCRGMGIESLAGLALFDGLTTLRLSGNKLRDLVELTRIIGLETLYLDDNRVVDPVPLTLLPFLRYLDLAGNPELQCPRPESLSRVTTLILPKHCR